MNQSKSAQNLPACLLVTSLLLSACGGGSGSTDGASNGTDQSQSTLPAPTLGAPRGEIFIKRRGTKSTVDGWFIDVVTNTDSETMIWQQGTEQCSLASQADPTAQGIDLTAPATGSYWRNAYSAGESITLSSRSGDYAVLRPQTMPGNVDGPTIYATTERWIREEMPDDVVLSVAGNERFPAFDNITLSAVEPMSLAVPQDNKLTQSQKQLEWTAASTAGNTIELLLTRSASTLGENLLAQVSCSVTDDGSFALPPEVFSALTENSGTAIDVLAYRQRITRSDGAMNASLTIVQQNFP